MYASEVDGRRLTFAVSGQLWEGSLVMIDEETESLWSHILGEAMRGELVGKKLTAIPSQMTDWGSWKERFPHSTVAFLPRMTDDYVRGFWSPAPGFVGIGLGYGLVTGDEARFWDFQVLRLTPVVNDHFGEIPIVLVYDARSQTAVAFRRIAGGRTLEFERKAVSGELLDRQTETLWDPLTGRAKEGPLQGEQLELLPGIVSDTAAWMRYHPLGSVWSPQPTPESEK